jgi:HTH-type transcriptional regulator/antitoxin HipB
MCDDSAMEFNLLLADQIGAHLKSLRKLRGLSQAQLGQRLGVGQARVAAIEADPGAVSVEQLLRVFQVLGVDLVARVKPDPVKLTQARLEEAQVQARLDAQIRLEDHVEAQLKEAQAQARLDAQTQLENHVKAQLKEAQAQARLDAQIRLENQVIAQLKEAQAQARLEAQ